MSTNSGNACRRWPGLCRATGLTLMGSPAARCHVWCVVTFGALSRLVRCHVWCAVTFGALSRFVRCHILCVVMFWRGCPSSRVGKQCGEVVDPSAVGLAPGAGLARAPRANLRCEALGRHDLRSLDVRSSAGLTTMGPRRHTGSAGETSQDSTAGRWSRHRPAPDLTRSSDTPTRSASKIGKSGRGFQVEDASEHLRASDVVIDRHVSELSSHCIPPELCLSCPPRPPLSTHSDLR